MPDPEAQDRMLWAHQMSESTLTSVQSPIIHKHVTIRSLTLLDTWCIIRSVVC